MTCQPQAQSCEDASLAASQLAVHSELHTQASGLWSQCAALGPRRGLHEAEPMLPECSWSEGWGPPASVLTQGESVCPALSWGSVQLPEPLTSHPIPASLFLQGGYHSCESSYLPGVCPLPPRLVLEPTLILKTLASSWSQQLPEADPILDQTAGLVRQACPTALRGLAPASPGPLPSLQFLRPSSSSHGDLLTSTPLLVLRRS